MAAPALAQRQALVAVTRSAKAELAAAWRLLDGYTAEQVRDFLIETLPAIADKYGLAAGSLAADFYDDARFAAAARGAFVAEPAALPTRARMEALARWGVDPLFRPEPDMQTALSLISGGLQRIVANQHRLTVVENSLRDPGANGWARYGRGDTCDWCRVLIGRGAVYTSSTARFAAHDNCNCVAGPDFKKVRTYSRSERWSEANNRHIRAYAY